MGSVLGACSPARVEPAPLPPSSAATTAPAPTAEPSVAPSPSPAPSATALAPATAKPEPCATAAAPPPPSPQPRCAKPEPMCVSPSEPPPIVGMVVPPTPPSYPKDKNGCIVDYPSDTCAGRQVLSRPTFTRGQCCYTICRTPIPPCGRPLLVGGAPVVAPPAPREDWARAPIAPPSALASELAAAWLADAALEHASVASFARFALELLAVGAPPELVVGAHRAALDEVEHARLAYGLASAFGGVAVGPGPLDVGGVVFRSDLAALTASAVREGCVGETFAAIGARVACARCTDPATSEVLRTIADDELVHAELAFRFVAWAVRVGGPDVAAAALRAFEAGVPASWERSPRERDPAWRAFGRLDGEGLREAAAITRSIGDDAARALGLGRPDPDERASTSVDLRAG